MTIEDTVFLKLDAEWMYERYRRYLECETGPAFILSDDANSPLCAFGCAVLWDGVAEAWFNLIRKENTITQIRIVKRCIESQIVKLKIRRLHATAKCTSDISKKFVEAMGFRCETPFGMKAYNPDGSAAYLYSRTV